MSSIDGIPSVTKQGYSVQLLKSSVGGYNAGMMKINGELLLIARVVTYETINGIERLMFKLAWFKQAAPGSEFSLAEFSLDFLGFITLPGFPEDGHAEDPRVFRGPNNSLYVSFCHATDDLKQPPLIRLAKFRRVSEVDNELYIADLLPVIHYAGNGAEVEEDRRPQKNWNFFFQGERLFCIYWTYPHKVLEIEPTTMVVINEWSGEDDKRFAWQYGPLSGGTPPVLWRGKYLAFYHGFMPHPVRRRRYYMGAYTFETKPPFRILEITRPLLRGSLNDPTNFEPPNHAGLPLVVFPCGLLVEEKDPDQMNVSMGVNDSYMGLGTFDMRLLPLVPVEEMKEVKTFYFFTQDVSVPPRATQATHLSWTPTINNFGGVLATQNPVAIDDCLTRGGVAEITKEIYDEMVHDGASFDLPAKPGDLSETTLHLFERIVEKACRLPGWSTPAKNVDFASIILATKPDVAVEIGVYGGRSLVSIAMAMQANKKGIVYGIDPWTQRDSIEGEAEANVEWWGSLDHESIYRTCCAAVDRFGLGDYVQIIRKRSDVAEVPHDIGLLIIDGNHSGFAPMGDVARYVPNVKIGGFIYMDDIGWIGGKVSEAAERLQDEYGCRLLYARDEGAMFQKIR